MPRKKRQSTAASRCFSLKLRELVEQSDATETEICDALKISSGQLFNYLHDYTTPTVDVLARVSDYFGVDANFLLFGVRSVNRQAAATTGLSDASIERLRLMKLKADGDAAAGWRDTPERKALTALNGLLENPSNLLLSLYYFVFGSYDGFSTQPKKEILDHILLVDRDNPDSLGLLVSADSLQSIFLTNLEMEIIGLREKVKGGKKHGKR